MPSSRPLRLLRLAMLAAAAAALALGTKHAFASGDPPATAAPLTQVTHPAIKGAKRFVSLTDTDVSTTSSTSYVNLAATTIDVPANQSAQILARFSGESLCEGGSNGWCSLRILVDGVEMDPQVFNNFAFDAPGDTWESHSIDRTSHSRIGVGTHTITVQYSVVAGATQFSLDDWQLTVEEWRAS